MRIMIPLCFGYLCLVPWTAFAAETETEVAEAIVVEESTGDDQEAVGETVEAEETQEGYPVRYALRPLVMDKGMVRADARVTVGGTFGPDTFSSLDLGGAVTPIDNLEIGVSSTRLGAIPPRGGNGLITVIMSPDATYGDIPIYGRYQFFEGEHALIGADVVLTIPSNTDFVGTLGLPIRILELFGLFTMDMAVDLNFRAGDRYPSATGSPSDFTFDANFSGASTTNITDTGFIQVGGGVGVFNVGGGDDASAVVELPFFLGGGYTYEADNVLVDFFLQAGWQPLMTANAPPGVDVFNVGDTWFVSLGAVVYTEPLFGD